MLICFVSALGSHEMGRHKLPIIIIIITRRKKFSEEGTKQFSIHSARSTRFYLHVYHVTVTPRVSYEHRSLAFGGAEHNFPFPNQKTERFVSVRVKQSAVEF